MTDSKTTHRPWNSLEVCKLGVTISTPIVVFLLGCVTWSAQRDVLQHWERDQVREIVLSGCDAAAGWKNQPEPQLVDRREQVLDAMTAYQITSMMEGVVQGGTATVMKEVGKPIAGKTGTTNDEKAAWFIGFSPEVVVGV